MIRGYSKYCTVFIEGHGWHTFKSLQELISFLEMITDSKLVSREMFEYFRGFTEYTTILEEFGNGKSKGSD